MSDGGLLTPLFTAGDVEAAISDVALLTAMLEVESALAAVQAEHGLVPQDAAAAIAAVARDLPFDPVDLGRRALAAGNPVNPLVRMLTGAVPAEARAFVHFGTTSQDVLDSALMLITRRAVVLILDGIDQATDALLRLLDGQRGTVLPARTLGQQALPTTVGRVAAGWLVALDDASERLGVVADERLAVQLGGAAGTLAGLDGQGPALMRALALRLGLAEPALPWHSDRQRVLDLAGALGGVVAATGKTALDLVLLAQTEIAELVPGAGGGSTAMPHKQNPVDAILVRSLAFRAPGLVATLFATAAGHENERAAGAWHAEWEPLRELLSLAGGAVVRLTAALSEVRADVERMQADVRLTGGLLLSESVASRLTPQLGRDAAHDLVATCATRAVEAGQDFDTVLRADPHVRAVLDDAELDAALEPASWTDSADALIERALLAHRQRRHRRNR